MSRRHSDPRHGQSGIRAASGEDEGTIDWHGPGICCKAAGRKTRRRYRSGKSGEALDLQLMSTIPLLAALRGSAVSIDGTQPKYSPGYWAARFREQ